MAEEIAFENGRISNFEWLVILTLTLDRFIQHTVVHHSSTSTYMPNFIEIEENICGRTDGRLRPALSGRLCWRVDLKSSWFSSLFFLHLFFTEISAGHVTRDFRKPNSIAVTWLNQPYQSILKGTQSIDTNEAKITHCKISSIPDALPDSWKNGRCRVYACTTLENIFFLFLFVFFLLVQSSPSQID